MHTSSAVSFRQITPDRKIMDEETVRARTVHSERKQREEDMIASAIVSEAVDLEVRPSIACSYGKRIEASM